MMTNLFSKASSHVMHLAFFAALLVGTWGNNSALSAQKFSLQIPDTVALNEAFPIRFSIENADVDRFEAPYIKSLELVSGPSTAQNIKSINGQVSKSIHYTYMFRATKKGKIKIADISVPTAQGKLTCAETYVVVTEQGAQNKTKQQEMDGNISNFQFGFGNDFFNQDFFNQGFGFGNGMMPNMDMFRMPDFSFDFPDLSNMRMPNMQDFMNRMQEMAPNMQFFHFDMKDLTNPQQMPSEPKMKEEQKTEGPSKSKYPIYKI